MKKKKLPKREIWHDEYYKNLLVKHGWNKAAVRHINTLFLEVLEVEDTPKNRDALRRRTRKINPNYPECDPEIRKELEAKRQDKSDVLKQSQTDDYDTCRLVLEVILEKAEKSYLTSDLENVSVRDIIDIIKMKLEINKQEAKLYALYPETQQKLSIEDQDNAGEDISGELPDID